MGDEHPDIQVRPLELDFPKATKSSFSPLVAFEAGWLEVALGLISPAIICRSDSIMLSWHTSVRWSIDVSHH